MRDRTKMTENSRDTDKADEIEWYLQSGNQKRGKISFLLRDLTEEDLKFEVNHYWSHRGKTESAWGRLMIEKERRAKITETLSESEEIQSRFDIMDL